MDTYIAFMCEYAPQAPWVIFLLLMLAGLNIPISEDILLLTAGAIAASCHPDLIPPLFIWTFIGCWVSAWEAYALGRLLGPKLYQFRWFTYLLSKERVDRLHRYYEKFGTLTFIVGRFIPGGVRNALFITSGLGNMPFHKFIIRDGFACLLSTSFLFYTGYLLGQNLPHLVESFEKYQYTVYASILSLALGIGGVIWFKKKYRQCATLEKDPE